VRMDVQLWDFDIADKISLDFYQKISLQNGDGSRIPLWGEYKSDDAQTDDLDGCELIFESRRVLTKEEIEEFQDQLSPRLKGGWYHEIH
jgi:hypothetical protein